MKKQVPSHTADWHRRAHSHFGGQADSIYQIPLLCIRHSIYLNNTYVQGGRGSIVCNREKRNYLNARE